MPSEPSATPSCTTVYYNSACPVCDAGIAFQRQRMQGCNVDFVDIHSRPDRAAELGVELESLRERLHVRDADGAVQVGDRAFAALWAQTHGQRWMAWLVRRLYWLSGPLYNGVARILYCWNRQRGHW